MDDKKKILIATGIYPPDIGGPATFCKILAEEFPKRGITARVITFSDEPKDSETFDGSGTVIEKISRRRNIFSRYLKFFSVLGRAARGADLLYAFDLMSTGLPAVLVKIFRPKLKLAIRLGGDRQWERAVEEGFRGTLEIYYLKKKFGIREWVTYAVSQAILRRADLVIFNAEIIRDIYVKFRGVKGERAQVIKNIDPADSYSVASSDREKNKVLLYAGRLVAFKNLPLLIQAFDEATKRPGLENFKLEIIGEGPEKDRLNELIGRRGLGNKVKLLPKINRDDLQAKIADVTAVATVSLTEVNSNFIIESLAIGTPVILSRVSEEGHLGNTDPLIHYVDPLSINDVAEKIAAVFGGAVGTRESRPKSVRETAWSLERVVSAHLTLFQALETKKSL